MNKSHLKLEFYLLLAPAAATLKCASGCGDVVKLLIIHVALAEPQQAKVSVILDFFFFFCLYTFWTSDILNLYISLPLDLKTSFLSELSCTFFFFTPPSVQRETLQTWTKLIRPEPHHLLSVDSLWKTGRCCRWSAQSKGRRRGLRAGEEAVEQKSPGNRAFLDLSPLQKEKKTKKTGQETRD